MARSLSARCTWLAAALLLCAAAVSPTRAAEQLPDLRVTPRPLPEFGDASPGAWINSPPLRRADLKGQVVLIEVWTSA